MAAEIAYYTYMYAKVEKERYQKVTGHARASLLSGRFIASVLAQILYSSQLMDVRQLNYISLGGERKAKSERNYRINFFLQLKSCHWSSHFVCHRSGPASTCGATIGQARSRMTRCKFPNLQEKYSTCKDIHRLTSNRNSPGTGRGFCCGNISSKRTATRQSSFGPFGGRWPWEDSFRFKATFNFCGSTSTRIRKTFTTDMWKRV